MLIYLIDEHCSPSANFNNCISFLWCLNNRALFLQCSCSPWKNVRQTLKQTRMPLEPLDWERLNFQLKFSIGWSNIWKKFSYSATAIIIVTVHQYYCCSLHMLLPCNWVMCFFTYWEYLFIFLILLNQIYLNVNYYHNYPLNEWCLNKILTCLTGG